MAEKLLATVEELKLFKANKEAAARMDVQVFPIEGWTVLGHTSAG